MQIPVLGLELMSMERISSLFKTACSNAYRIILSKTRVQTQGWDDILKGPGFSMKNFLKSLQHGMFHNHILSR